MYQISCTIIETLFILSYCLAHIVDSVEIGKIVGTFSEWIAEVVIGVLKIWATSKNIGLFVQFILHLLVID